MSRCILLLALLQPISLLCVGQSIDRESSVPSMRPVKQLANQMRPTSEIQLTGFEFKQLFFSHHSGMVEIKGQPTKGARFFVEARLYAEEAIATAKFEAVDAGGKMIQKILIGRQADAGGGSGFYGVMKVPNVPFRVVMSGEGIDGKRYRRTYERLFRPTTRQHSAIILPPGPAANSKQRHQLEAARQEYMDKMEADLRIAGETVVMPRTRVSNVMYAPYLSRAGRPLGVRITFDVEFSHDGYYNPEMHLSPNYKNVDWRGRIDMKPLRGSIEPQPAEAGSPQIQPHILAYGAGYLYRKHTTYHFTAEYVPDYVIENEKKTKFCIFHHKYKYSPEMQVAWRAILASETPTKYNVYVDNTNFRGEIEGLHAQGMLFKSFLAEGAKDCGEQPTNRF